MSWLSKGEQKQISTDALYSNVLKNQFYLIRLVAIIILAAFLYFKVIKKLLDLYNRVKLINRIPGPPPFTYLLGHIPVDVIRYIGTDSKTSNEFFSTLVQAIRGLTHIFEKERIYKLWLSWDPVIIVWKPETVETILSDNFLLTKSDQYTLLHPWLGTGLLTATGTKWRHRRKLLVPAFHFKILHDFVPVFNEQSQVMVDRLRKAARTGRPLNIVPIVTACTLDIICETVMGVSIGAQKDSKSDYCNAVREVGECFIERLMQPAYWPENLYYRFSRGQCFIHNVHILHDFTRKVIRDRKQELLGLTDGRNFEKATKYIGHLDNENKLIPDDGPKRRKAFMDLLLENHLNGGNLSEEDIREEVDTFMFEGHDTTAMALSWVIYLLGHHKDVQDKLATEVQTAFRSAEEDNYLSLTQLKDLRYLEAVIKEGLRLCPSVPMLGRRTTEEMKLMDYRVPKGTTVYVFVYMLHRDPEMFPDPERFKPERFLDGNNGRHPFCFVPFSAGPRNCIGQRFAMSELKTVLAHFINSYEWTSLDPLDEISFNMEMVLRPKVPLNLIIKDRN